MQVCPGQVQHLGKRGPSVLCFGDTRFGVESYYSFRWSGVLALRTFPPFTFPVHGSYRIDRKSGKWEVGAKELRLFVEAAKRMTSAQRHTFTHVLAPHRVSKGFNALMPLLVVRMPRQLPHKGNRYQCQQKDEKQRVIFWYRHCREKIQRGRYITQYS